MAFVYLIAEEPLSNEDSGPWTKIGYSKNPPEWRLDANLKRGNPRNLYVAAAYEYDSVEDAYAAEQLAHEAFAELSHQKEWFQVAWQDVAQWFERSGAKARS